MTDFDNKISACPTIAERINIKHENLSTNLSIEEVPDVVCLITEHQYTKSKLNVTNIW